MSQELNLAEIGYGSLDPGWSVEIYTWTTSEQSYDTHRRRARFFTAVPDSQIPLGDIGTIEFYPNVVEVEITRTWNMVRVDENGGHVLQWNVAMLNPGGSTTGYHLLEAESDN
jgi:hypothetical protein